MDFFTAFQSKVGLYELALLIACLGAAILFISLARDYWKKHKSGGGKNEQL